MKFGKCILAPLALFCIVLATTDSFAQFGGRGSMGGSPRGGRDQSNGQAVRQPQPDYDAYEQIEYRLSLLEDDLRLQSGQRAPWDIFASKVRAYANDVARAKARATVVSASAGAGLQYIDRTLDAARNQLTALEDIAVAAKALYAGLNPNQITLADMRMPTLVAPQPRVATAPNADYNLPDLGSAKPPLR